MNIKQQLPQIFIKLIKFPILYATTTTTILIMNILNCIRSKKEEISRLTKKNKK